MRTIDVPFLPLTVTIQSRKVRPVWGLRTLLALVALAAVGVAGLLEFWRSDYRQWFEYHAVQAELARGQARAYRQKAAQTRVAREAQSDNHALLGQLLANEEFAANYESTRDSHQREAERYRRAMMTPWKRVAPDPQYAPLHPGGNRHYYWAHQAPLLRKQYRAFLATLK